MIRPIRGCKRVIIVLIAVTVFFCVREYITRTSVIREEKIKWTEDEDAEADNFPLLDTSQKCKVPVLNPHHPVVDPFLRKANKEKIKQCTMKRHTYVTPQGLLKLNLDNVQSAGLNYVRRVDDFNIQLSKRISLTPQDGVHQDRPLDGRHCNLYCKDSGRCDYCGNNGFCCRKGYENCPSVLIKQAAMDYHSCIYTDDQAKEEESVGCYDRCGGGGACSSVCGAGGYCCQRGSNTCAEFLQGKAPPDRYACVLAPPAQRVDVSYQLEEEFARLELLINNTYSQEYHAFVSAPTAGTKNPTSPNGGVNVLLLMLDSISNSMFQRAMKNTYRMLDDNPNSFVFKGHTIVGDGTTAQLCAMLTGTPEHLLPQAKRGMKGAQSVDRWPFIFNKFHAASYKTLYSEDDPETAAFNFRLLGFNNPPTDKYLRSYWIALEHVLRLQSPMCSNKLSFDYLKRYFNAYKSYSKFAVSIFSDFFHNSMNSLELADDDIVGFFKFLDRNGHSNNTVIILLGDHGLRIGDFRSTLQGKLEERLPFVSITVPSWFHSFPQLMKNMKENTNVMTSHFDIHATLEHLLTFPRLNTKSTSNKFGKSLFSNIKHLNRTCDEAGVGKHWCPCFDFQIIPVTDTLVADVVARTVHRMNFLNNEHPETQGKCHELTTKAIVHAARHNPSENVVQFLGTGKNEACDSCEVNVDRSMRTFEHVYRINFAVEPSDGAYEVTAKVVVNQRYGNHSFQHFDISRTNSYGDEPACIANVFPHLRKYCFCRTP